MDADPHQWYQQNEYSNEQWEDYSTTARVGPQYNTTPVHEYEGLDFRKACLHRPGPAAAHLGHFNIDNGHATYNSWPTLRHVAF